jgi:2-polyprenyl-3-methyl-5-hydroxy-6-metoxy-1,4-benzoquinol methylase
MKPTTYHSDWQVNRINFILSKYPKEFFKNKNILELGAFNGYIGAYFQSLGANVHCIEGRQENVNQIKLDYPQLSVECSNLDVDYWNFGKWDIIINFGLYYHLEHNHKLHLINCLNNCNLMFFESVIFDSNKPVLFYRNESGIDQSLGSTGGNP